MDRPPKILPSKAFFALRESIDDITTDMHNGRRTQTDRETDRQA